MSVTIVPRMRLTADQVLSVTERIGAAEHANDGGAGRDWGNPALFEGTYIAFVESEGVIEPFGIVYAGGQPHETSVAWWIDIKYRGQHLGRKMIDAFAIVLREGGVTGIGRIPIHTFAGRYDAQSISLRERLNAHFASSGA